MILNVETLDINNHLNNKMGLCKMFPLVAKAGDKLLCLPGKKLLSIYEMIDACYGKSAGAIKRRYFKKLTGVNPDAFVSSTTIVEDGTILPAAYMAMACSLGDISVGLTGTKYGDQLCYSIMPGEYSSIMLTKDEQLLNDDYKRWLFVRSFENKEDFQNAITISESKQGKHFDSRLTKLPYTPSTRWSKDWIDNTKGGAGHDAKFMPGLKAKSVEHYYLIYLALKAAYSQKLYTLKSQDGFILDLLTPIGAANGDVVSRIVLYCAENATIHIRPYESTEEKCVELRRPYTPGKLEYDLI